MVIERTTTFDENEEPTLAFYTTSQGPTPGCARRFGELARGHWGGSESRNHRARDAWMCGDKTRSKNYHLNCNLSALQSVLTPLRVRQVRWFTCSWNSDTTSPRRFPIHHENH